MTSLHDEIADLLLTTQVLEAIAFGPFSRAANEAADRLAADILDLVAAHLPFGAVASAAAGPGLPQLRTPTIAPLSATDNVTLAHESATDINLELRDLCARAGVMYHDVGFRENQAVVIATDRDGTREYYTLAALLDAAAAGAEEPQDAVAKHSHLNTASTPPAGVHRAGNLLSPRGSRAMTRPAAPMAPAPRGVGGPRARRPRG